MRQLLLLGVLTNIVRAFSKGTKHPAAKFIQGASQVAGASIGGVSRFLPNTRALTIASPFLTAASMGTAAVSGAASWKEATGWARATTVAQGVTALAATGAGVAAAIGTAPIAAGVLGTVAAVGGALSLAGGIVDWWRSKPAL